MPDDLQDFRIEDGATLSLIRTGGIAYNKEEEEEMLFGFNEEDIK